MRKHVLTMIVFASLILFYSSCSKEDPGDCDTCGVAPSTNVHLAIGNVDVGFNCYSNVDVEGIADNGTYFHSDDVYTPAQIVNTFQNLGLSLAPKRGDKEIIHVVVYSNSSDIRDNGTVLEGIHGLLVYYGNTNEIYCLPYVKQGEAFTLINELTHHVGDITFLDIKAYGAYLKLMGKDFGEDIHIISLRGRIVSQVKGGLPLWYLIKQEVAINKIGKASKVTGPELPSGGSYCTNPCPTKRDEKDCSTATHPIRCTGGCILDIAKTIIEGNGSQYNIDNEEPRTFRDTYLVNSKKGLEYIDRYYFIGGYLRGAMSLSFALDALSTYSNSVSPLIDKLHQSPTSSAPFMSQAQFQDLTDMIIILRGVSQDSIYQAQLDIMETDLIYYSNKSVNQVDQDFK